MSLDRASSVSSLLQQQFIKVPLRLIGNIEQYRRIAYHLLLPRTAYIHRAPRHMITRRHSPRQPIHLRRPIPRINHNPLWRSPRVWRQSTVACDFTLGPDPSNHCAPDFTLGPDPSIHCAPDFTLGPDPSNHSQLLQPPANADQILNHGPTRNIPIRRHILRLTQLPKFKVRR